MAWLPPARLQSRHTWMFAASLAYVAGLVAGTGAALVSQWQAPATPPPAVLVVADPPDRLHDAVIAAWLDLPAAAEPAPGIDPEAVALIDRLVAVADEGFGTHPTAWAGGFIAIDKDLQFAGGVLGAKPPAVPPAMRDLVRMGVTALPSLLEHLSDARNTQLVVSRQGIIEWARHGDEYSPRYGDRRRWPAGVNGRDDGRWVDGHTIRVGDLCYIAVGAIVNRDLCVVRYQPTGGMIINSPVATPALAAAARTDWSGLTLGQHRRALIADAVHGWGSPSGLRRLCFYYPAAGESVAVKLLNGQRHDTETVRKFVVQCLLKQKDPDRCRDSIVRFAAANGPAELAMVPDWLNRVCEEASLPRQTPQDRENQDTARRLLAALYPHYDPERPQFINAADEKDKAGLIEALSGVRSGKLDTAVAAVFRSLDLEKYHGFERIDADDLALACMDRLVDEGMDAEFQAYCEQRIRELDHKQRETAEDQRLEALRERLRRIEQAGKDAGRR